MRIDVVDSPHPEMSLVVRDPVRRFYQNQKKINDGKSDKAAVCSGAELSLRPPAIKYFAGVGPVARATGCGRRPGAIVAIYRTADIGSLI
ncbi:hypothetical protein [Collimonas silvisoli]|uniref:hypothetical protein n=1 Tax=Collimonas silvisoli TaxID=2825884 RepID=UPI001B8B63E5|nr:hypothetical protein [Collimonas silvisoli]